MHVPPHWNGYSQQLKDFTAWYRRPICDEDWMLLIANKKPVSKLTILDLSTFETQSSNSPKIINSLPLSSYDLDSTEIINSLQKADNNRMMKNHFSSSFIENKLSLFKVIVLIICSVLLSLVFNLEKSV